MKRWFWFLLIAGLISGCTATVPEDEQSQEIVAEADASVPEAQSDTKAGPTCGSLKDKGVAFCYCLDLDGKQLPNDECDSSCGFDKEGQAACNCPDGFYPVKGTGEKGPYCRQQQKCFGSLECAKGFICKDGVCARGCETDEHCFDTQVCHNRQCVLKCQSNKDCRNQDICSSGGKCLPPECGVDKKTCPAEKPFCANFICVPTCKNAKCPVGQYCDSAGACQKECGSDKDCSGICQNKRCVAKQCDDSSGCQGASKFCNSGRCEAQCKVDTACPKGKVCQAGTCVDGCKTDTQCTAPAKCLNTDAGCSGEKCTKTCLKPCKVVTDCKDGFRCDSSYCRSGCKVDADCSNGEICEAGTRKCRTGCRSDANCGTKEICDSATLTCKAVACKIAGDCTDGKVCANNQCVPCTASLKCPGALICVTGKCTAKQCNFNTDCSQQGTICVDSQCIVGCTRNEHCQSTERCDTTTKKCYTACTTGSCPKGQNCNSTTSRCEAGCKTDTHCTTTQVCLNGACAPGCATDADCGGTTPVCRNKRCMSECTSAVAVCANGFLCKNNACKGQCSSTAPCPTGLICDSTGKCVAPQCSSNAGCSNGQICVSGQCTNCTNDNQCNSGQKCINNRCGIPSNTCSKNADCASGKVCINQVCVVGECTTNSNCPAGKPICDSSRCVQCGEDKHCTGGKKCIAGTCTDVTVVCSKDSDCNTGQICTSNKCTAPQCSLSKLCPSGQVCLSGRCEAKCDPTKCSTGKVCITVTNKCGDCKVDADCSSGDVCDSGSCKKAPKQCTSTSDCTTPFVCKNGTCQTCVNNTDCAQGEECKAGKCQAIITQCTKNTDCGNSGQICSSGKCVDCSADTDCGTNQYCATVAAVGKRCRTGCRVGACTGSQVCDPTTRVCVECVADNDCSSAAGKFCVSNKCVACKGDTDCAPGQVCQTNVCKAGGTACLSNADCKAGETCTNGRCQFFCNAQTTVCSTPGEICLQSNKCGPNTSIVASPRKAGAHRLVINVGSNLYTGVNILDWSTGSQWSTTRVNKYRAFVNGKMVFTWPTDAKGDLLPLRVTPMIDGLGAQPCPPTSTSTRVAAFASFADWKCDTAKSSTGACTMFGLQMFTGSTYGPSHSISQAFGKCSPKLTSTTRNWGYYVPPSQP